jgi:hypothetical protein
MAQTEKNEILLGTVCRIMVKVRDLPLFLCKISLQPETETAPTRTA